MHPQKKADFSERMIALLRRRTEQRPLPKGYMRCPLNAEHHVPIASIVTHIEKVHNGDALGLIEDAMYSHGTKARLDAFFEQQELNYRRWCAKDRSSSSDSSFSSYSSSYSTNSQSRSESLGREGCDDKSKHMGNSRSHHLQQMRSIDDKTVLSPNSHGVNTPAHVCPRKSFEFAHAHDSLEPPSHGDNGPILPTPSGASGMKRPRSTKQLSNPIAPVNPTIGVTPHHEPVLPYSVSVHSSHEANNRYIPLRQQYLYGAPGLQFHSQPPFQQQAQASLGTPVRSCSKPYEVNASTSMSFQTSQAAAGLLSLGSKLGADECVLPHTYAPLETEKAASSLTSSQSRQQEGEWRARSIILQYRTLKPQFNNAVDKDTPENASARAVHGVAVGEHGDNEMWDLWCLLYPHVKANTVQCVTSSSVSDRQSSGPRESAQGPSKMPITDLIYHPPRVVLIMENEIIKAMLLNSLKADSVLMAKYEVLQ
ncbi:unnamed protein product [Phytomonas sp. EM1]|nr:unnamed protein product [Phytomonas sp. EM1]|eukprot:CCW61956.1 unnamed protein product [Phytomonas sp. isolate EM1]